jgi:uncharacterized protein (TIGR03067 family)
MWRGLVILFLATSLASADDKQEAAARELKKLEGDWKALKSEDDGRESDGGNGILIEKDKMRLKIGDRVVFTGTITIDPSAEPKTIDLKYTDGPGVTGMTQRGIYRWDGDKLEICWNPVGKDERPKKFTTKAAPGNGFQYRKYEKKD